MKFNKILLSFFLLFTFVFSTHNANAQNNVTVLKNGLRVLIKEDKRFPLVSVRLYVHAGAGYEDPKHAGLSHLLEHMVFRGTQKRPDGALAKEIESVGGDFNAYTSTDETVYYTNLPSKEWKRGIDVVADMALNPILDPKVLEEEKKVVYAEMGQRRESPEMRLYENTMEQAFEGTSYSFGVLGTEESLSNVKVEDIEAYMKKYYNPQNMLLVVVGDINKEEVLHEAEKHFAAKQNAENSFFPSSLELPLFDETKIFVEESELSKVLINIAFPSPSSFDTKSRNLDIFGLLIGGLDTSYLRQKYEIDQQLVNSIGAYNIGYNRAGLFAISVDLEADKLEEFWQEFTKDLAKLSTDNFTQEQLDTAKFLYEVSFQRKKATVSGLASILGNSEFASPGEFSLDNYLDSIQKISAKDIEKSLDAWIKPNNMVISVLAPKALVEENKLPDFLSIVEQNWTDTLAHSNKQSKIENEESKAYEEIILAKGSKIILLEDRTMPFVVAELKYTGGDSLLSPKEQGLSSALASILPEATKKLNKKEFSAFLEQKAISLSASTARESFALLVDTPAQFQKEAFEQLSEIIDNSAFNSEDWLRIQKDILTTIKDTDENPNSKLFSEFFPTMFQGNAYAYKRSGTKQSVENFTLKQLTSLWDKQKEQSWILTVAGDFDKEIVLSFAGKLEKINKQTKKLSMPKWQNKKKSSFVIDGKKHAYILQTFPTVPYTHEDSAALTVLKTLLGDMSGILFREVRDKQNLAYSVAPIFFSSKDVGSLSFYVNTALENREKILPAFEKIIKDLKAKTLSEEEIESAKLTINSDYIKAKQALGARVSEASENAFLGRPKDFQEEFMKKVQEVSAKDVQEVAKKYLDSKKAYLLEVSSKADKSL